MMSRVHQVSSIFKYESYYQEKRNTDQKRQEVNDIERGTFLMLDLGNQIGSGDVNEISGGEGKKKSHVEGERRTVRNDAADQESER